MKREKAIRPPDVTARCLDVISWRLATAAEIRDFIKGQSLKRASGPARGSRSSALTVLRRLIPVDMYCYLKARFGDPNGVQNYFRRNTSDNLFHWEFMLKADKVEVSISGKCRAVQLRVSEEMTDENWRDLILAIKSDYKRVAKKKSLVFKTLENWVIFPNRYVAIADLCADLHAKLTESVGGYKAHSPKLYEPRKWKRLVLEMDKRAQVVFRSGLQLSILTPILAEAFINLLILTLCKPELRADQRELEDFFRSRIHVRLLELASKCDGFRRPIDRNSATYKRFLKIMNKRNDTIHGNHNPERKNQRVYFEGTRPLFAEPGDQTFRYFEAIEHQYRPETVIRDYEDVHEFLAELTSCLKPQYAKSFRRLEEDHFPGFDILRRKIGCLFPHNYINLYMQGERFEDDLAVTWTE